MTNKEILYNEGWKDCEKAGYDSDKYNDIKYPESRDQVEYWRGWYECQQKHFKAIMSILDNNEIKLKRTV